MEKEEMKKRLKSFRKKVGITQKEAGEFFGVHERTFRKWENGERRMSGPALKILEICEKELKEKEKFNCVMNSMLEVLKEGKRKVLRGRNRRRKKYRYDT